MEDVINPTEWIAYPQQPNIRLVDSWIDRLNRLLTVTDRVNGGARILISESENDYEVYQADVDAFVEALAKAGWYVATGYRVPGYKMANYWFVSVATKGFKPISRWRRWWHPGDRMVSPQGETDGR